MGLLWKRRCAHNGRKLWAGRALAGSARPSFAKLARSTLLAGFGHWRTIEFWEMLSLLLFCALIAIRAARAPRQPAPASISGLPSSPSRAAGSSAGRRDLRRPAAMGPKLASLQAARLTRRLIYCLGCFGAWATRPAEPTGAENRSSYYC